VSLLPAPRHRHSYRTYLELERDSSVRHEYYDGEIYAMAGGTPEHAMLAMSIGAALVEQFGDRPCRVMSSDLNVKILPTGLATYPDVTVVCGPLELDPESKVTVTNPALVVEVLGDATESYDRGEKLQHYQQVPSLQACVLVSHRARRVETWQRKKDGTWSQSAAGPGEAITLQSLAVTLEVDRIYRGVFENA
jgi:Uma2 family endonuclease